MKKLIAGLAIASLALPSAALGAPSSDVQRALKASSIDDYGFKQKLIACFGTEQTLNKLLKRPKNFTWFVQPKSKLKMFNNLFTDYMQYVLKVKSPPEIKALMKDKLIVSLNEYLMELFAIEEVASVDKAIDTCKDTYSRFMEQAPDLIEQATNSSKKSDLPKSSRTSKDNHSQCLEARDYEGCMRVKSSGGITAPVGDFCNGPLCKITTKGNDSFGLPKPMGWWMYSDEGWRILYFSDPYRVPHKGQQTRYVGMKRITRYYQNPKAGTSGTVIGGGTSYTDCTGYGSSINCSTSGGNAKYIPGQSATPGGVQSSRFDSVYDCKDNTYASYEGARRMGSWVKNPNHDWAKMLKKECNKGPASIMKLDTMKVQM